MGLRNPSAAGWTHSLGRGLTELREAACGQRPRDQASDGISPRAFVVLRQLLGLRGHRLSARTPTEGKASKARVYV